MVNSNQNLVRYSLKNFFIIAILIQIFRFITLYFQLQNSNLYVMKSTIGDGHKVLS